MFGIGGVEILVIAIVVAALVLVGVSVAILGSFRSTRRDDRALVARLAGVKDLAWAHRDVDPELAAALITQIEGYERRELVVPGMFDELMHTAWDYRETNPSLSTIVIDEIRQVQRPELG